MYPQRNTKPDELSLSESRRIHQKLHEMELSIDKVIINGSTEAPKLGSLRTRIPAGRHISMPHYEEALTGLPILNEYITAHADRFKEL